MKLVSQVMCGVSTSLRFPGQLNGSDNSLLLSSLAGLTRISLVIYASLALTWSPFPASVYSWFTAGVCLILLQLHFLMPSYAPFYNPQDKAFLRMSVADLTQA